MDSDSGDCDSDESDCDSDENDCDGDESDHDTAYSEERMESNKENMIPSEPQRDDTCTAKLETSSPPLSTSKGIVDPLTRRDQHTATLAATGRLSTPTIEQKHGGMLAEIAGLVPINVQVGKQEYNLLGSADVVSDLVNDKCSSNASFHHTPSSEPLDNISNATIGEITRYQIALPAIKRWMNYESYVELDESLATAILNTDWTRRPWLRFVASRMMEGAILLESGIGYDANP